jgi:hypothetical protein
MMAEEIKLSLNTTLVGDGTNPNIREYKYVDQRYLVASVVLPHLRGLKFYPDRIVDLTPKAPGVPYVPDPEYAVNNENFFEAIYQFLKQTEDFATTRYVDSAGKVTIGIGFNMDQWGTDAPTRNSHLCPILEAIGEPEVDCGKIYSGQQSLTEDLTCPRL